MIVHTIHVPVSANRFVAPVVSRLRHDGMPAELWVADAPHQASHLADARTRCPVREVACDLSINPLASLRRAWSLIAAMSERRPVVVHAHQTRAALLPLLVARLLRVPVRVYHNHGLPYLGYTGVLRTGLRVLERINMGLATRTLLVSHSNRDAARADGLLRARQGHVLGGGSAVGIDLAQWPDAASGRRLALEFRQLQSIPREAFVALFVGRPNARKGYMELIRAWEQGGFADRGGVLLCAGFGTAEATPAGKPLPAGVLPLGMLHDLRPVYAACDVLCLPSWHEGLSYAVLEAYASLRPVIVSDIPGLRSEVLPGLTGLSIPVHDVAALAVAMRQLEDQPGLRRRMGRIGGMFVKRRFDQQSVLARYSAWYRSILPRCGTARHAG